MATVGKRIWDFIWHSMAALMLLLSKCHIFIMLFLCTRVNPPPAEPWAEGFQVLPHKQ